MIKFEKFKYKIGNEQRLQLFSQKQSKESLVLLRKQIKNYNNIREKFKPVNLLKRCIEDGKLILPKNTLLHFSQGKKNVDEMLNGIKNYGLLNAGALGELNLQSDFETHTVVDCWRIKDSVPYSTFANFSAERGDFVGEDSSDYRYVPQKHLSDFDGKLPSEGTQYDLLNRVGWIITPQDPKSAKEINEYLYGNDVFSNGEYGKYFKGQNLQRFIEKIKDDSGQTQTTVGHSTVLFGIPNNLITGVIINYHDLYSEDFLNKIYEKFNDKVIVAPNGEVIHIPADEKNTSDNIKNGFKDMLWNAKKVIQQEEMRLNSTFER